MTETRLHPLPGLEPDNLLAFLALLGLLRSLEAVRPEWRPRARWAVNRLPLRPELILRAAVTQGSVCAAASEGVLALAEVHEFGGKDAVDYSRKQSREALIEARSHSASRAALLSALFSDAVEEKNGGQVATTPLLMKKQGQQTFLNRLADVPKQALAPARASAQENGVRRSRKARQIPADTTMAEALFATWERPDDTHQFRWDPAADRRAALMAEAPTGVGIKTQHAANRLAAVALPLFPAVPTLHRGQLVLVVPGASMEHRSGFRLAWPIWSDAASLAAVGALLTHPRLRMPHALEHLSVYEVRESRLFRVGNGANAVSNFSPARVLNSET